MDADADALASGLVARGRRVKTARRVVAGAAGVAVIAASAWLATPLLRQTSPAPAGPITATVAPTATTPAPTTSSPTSSTPSPSAGSASKSSGPSGSPGKTVVDAVPGSLGTVTFKLPHEGVKGAPGTEEVDWKATDWSFKYCASAPWTVSGVVGAKAIEQPGPINTPQEATLVFADAATASRFVDDYLKAAQACDKAAASTTTRVRTALHQGPSGTGFGSTSTVTSWTEELKSGTWGVGYGGIIVSVAREGAVVVFTAVTGTDLTRDPAPDTVIYNTAQKLMTADLKAWHPTVCRSAGTC